MGKISKLFIENINTKVRSFSTVHQWKDTDAVINWFKNIRNKRKCISMQFDIEEFYPSISKELLQKAINHASAFVRINNEEINLIMHSRKSLLFDSNNVWIKKTVTQFGCNYGKLRWGRDLRACRFIYSSRLGRKIRER